MAKKKYWQGFADLNGGEAYEKLAQDEFREDLPFESDASKSDFTSVPASRRDFLKYLGFSTAAAIAAASCETPVRKAIPYLNKPQDMVPGVADYYATTYVSGGEAIPIVAKVRDGRPIKLEGNTLSSIYKGGTSARVQAAVLDLYDTARLRGPMITVGNAKSKTATSLEAADNTIASALNSLGGAPLALLTSTITSPTTKQIITDFLAKYPNSRHVQFEAVSYSGMLLANEITHDKRIIPSLRFQNAQVIVSLGADFLGTWLSPIEFAKQYATRRKINEKNPSMSKHYHFESMLSLTGANADERFVHRPSETGLIAAALLNAVSGQPVSGVDERLKKGIDKVAHDLIANRGGALVVCGSSNVQVQTIVNAINEAIGASGTTINWSSPMLSYQAIDADMEALVADMEAGRIGAVLVHATNPAYEYYNGERFKKALGRVRLSISFNDRLDETGEACNHIIPAHHFLESWGDAELRPGMFSMMQPTINPLFKTRQFQDSLLKWSGNASTYDAYFRTYWTNKLGSVENYDKALQDGVVESTPEAGAAPVFSNARIADAVSAVSGMKKSTKTELVIYQAINLGDGKQGNNPWLLELPDPITRATWDNYAMISTKVAKELDIKVDDNYEVNPEKPLVKFTINKKDIELPVMVVPGMHPDTIALAVGYGRSKGVGRAVVDNKGNPVGKNAYPALTFNGTTVDWYTPDVSYAKTGNEYKIAVVQTHSSYEGRHEVVKELTFAEYSQNPEVVLEERSKELDNYGGLENYQSEGTLYPNYPQPGIKWGMSIDLNSCIGCGACVVACHSENNVPVVGKHEVMRYHDMHWLRIDRYFSGNPDDAESIQTIFQPMLCQHCDNAPCENVCPVAATNHNSEGINQMAYNRCIGTRYCANNCPFKVRRFNWADYTGADSFPNNQKIDWVGTLDDVVLMMNDDLSRMVLNPDVTVRSRGVMEKCSFCVQRLQDGKLKAKKENRPLDDADATTACAQACPADAIVFGNVKNPDSAISQVRRDNTKRTFYSLEQLHVLPNVNYLAKVRNTDAEKHAG